MNTVSIDPAGFLTTLRADAEKAAVAGEANLEARVPSCPDWDVRELIVHLGRVHRWVTGMVRERAQERPSSFPPKPDEGDDVLTWFRTGADELVEALGNVGHDEPVWNWGDGTAKFWHRRQAHETAMHRWDAQNAVGEASPIDAALAADGIDEVFEMLGGNLAGQDLGTGQTIHLHSTDRDGEWTVTLSPDGLKVDRGHAKGDAAVRATASDLLLFAWNRIGVDAPGLETFGDATLLARWREVSKI